MPDITTATEETQSALEDLNDFIAHSDGEDIAMMFLKAFLLLVICIIVKRLFMKSAKTILSRTKVDPSLQRFILAFIQVILWLVIIVMVATALKIDATPLLAALGVIGLALSLAVQDTLGNIAAGLNLILTRPFTVGDFVEIDGDAGKVLEIGMVHTKFQTPDHRHVVLPNNKVTAARLINYSAEPQRRVDIRFSADYNAPVEKVKALVTEMVQAHPQAFSDPAPTVRVESYGDSAIAYILRVWCQSEDYWELHYDLLEEVRGVFLQHDIQQPYPHLNVHIVQKDREETE